MADNSIAEAADNDTLRAMLRHVAADRPFINAPCRSHMSIAADLFHSTMPRGETLHRRITPTEEQFEDQKTRWNDLASYLRIRLRNDTGLPTSAWLQGSYKFGTQIRPWKLNAEFDIDLGFYFRWEGRPADGVDEPQHSQNSRPNGAGELPGRCR